MQKVDDANNPACQNNGFSDNGSFQPIEYLYDPNGNMITDLNKEILNIAYDYNNLPQLIELSATGSQDLIYYWYDADGVKLRKQTRIDQAIVATTDYVGSFVYEDNTLQYILTDEGRIVPDGSNFKYQYFLKDHLSNTRILFDETGTVLQDNSYYPFGMAIDALCHSENFTPDNKYLYNGKELQDDFGLEWYDYGFRFYDPQLGRFPSIDPLASKAVSWSPYNAMWCNPILNVDPDGRWAGDYYDKTGKWIAYDGKDDHRVYHADDNGDVIFGVGVLNETKFKEWNYSIIDPKLEEYFPTLLGHEKGYVNNKNDAGGPTNKGITLTTFKKYAKELLCVEGSLENLKHLSKQQVAKIYEIGYWNPSKATNISDKQLGWLYFDTYINGGGTEVLNESLSGWNTKGIKGLNSVLKTVDATDLFYLYKSERICRYERLVDKKPNQMIFLNGWKNRVNSFTYKSE